MTEDFVSFELLCKLREKGYPCKQPRYEGHVYDVLKWLREEKKIEVIPSFDYVERTWGYQVGDMTLRGDVILAYLWGFKTYEAAAIAGIEYVIDNLI